MNKILIILVLLLIERFSFADIPVKSYEHVLQSIFAKKEISLAKNQDYLGEMVVGTVYDKDKLTKINLLNPFDFKAEDKDYHGIFVVYKDEQDKLLENFLKGSEVSNLKDDNFLIVAERKNQFLVKSLKVFLDKFAHATRKHFVKVGDFNESNTLQAKVEFESLYFINKTHEVIVAHRVFLYQLPKWELIFEATKKRFILSEEGYSNITSSSIDFINAEGDAPKSIRIKYSNTGETNIIAFKNGKYNHLDKPWVDKADAKRQEDAFELKMRLLNESGSPINGAKVIGNTKKINYLQWTEKSIPFEGHTDEKGEFRIKGKHLVSLEVFAEGYYTVKKSWTSNEIPKDGVILTLVKEDERVPMINGNGDRSIGIDWEKDEDMSIGIRLVNPRNKSEWKKRFIDTKEDAHLWIEIIKTNSNWKAWIIKIYTLNGVEIAPGSLKDETQKGDTMREAPINGYISSLEYKISECPQGFYLSIDGARRYGKVWFFNFEDRSSKDRIFRTLYFKYAIQSKSLGTRSLNPAPVPVD